ncbi:hypothetical protein [Pseudomonas sp. AB12(2023)]|uniref:hypothetical protein n=1 Tax=Pseudomonas sp. AB12(2023) TaxID=3048597 RepID=UPI002B230E4B|nr:hypothetical protein [Pseudomonas sp. AB12(2023)]MEB0222045.1 hypothetical protein [Pseudomonas sp. AB12(2023)]
MAEPRVTPGVTAADWYDVGYHDRQKGLSYDSGPHDRSADVIAHWDRGWYAAEVDCLDEAERAAADSE